MGEKALEAQVMELVCYLWDNYIQLYDSIDDIFLMGVGNAYLGVKALLMNRGMSPPHLSPFHPQIRLPSACGYSALLTPTTQAKAAAASRASSTL